MPARLPPLWSILALPLLLAGCKIDTINYFPPHPANVRVANFLYGAPAIDASVNGSPAWSNLAYTATGATLEYENNRTTFTFRAVGATADFASIQIDLAGEASYTLLAFGSTTTVDPGIMTIGDVCTNTTGGSFQTRIASIASLPYTLDLYITAPTDSIDDISPRISNFGYTGLTGCINPALSSGTTRIRITQYNTKTVIYDSGTITLPDGQSGDLVIYSGGSGALANVAMLGLGSAPVVQFPNTLARYRAVNAAPDSASVRSLVDGSVTTAGTTYPSASAYATVPAGPHAISFESEATPGATLASATVTLAPGTDSSILFSGLAGANAATPFADTNLPTSNVSLRLINASPDAPPLTIAANDTTLVTSLARNQASGYLSTAAGTYTFTIRDAASGAVLATIPGTTLNSNQVLSVYVVGPASGPGLMFVQDR